MQNMKYSVISVYIFYMISMSELMNINRLFVYTEMAVLSESRDTHMRYSRCFDKTINLLL